MGDNLRWNFRFPSPSSDPQDCVGELTWTNSDSSASAVTIENVRDPAANTRLGQSMVWTNEKHNLYLDFLEASFVKQLHCSLNLNDSRQQEEMWMPCPTQQLPDKGYDSYEQFSALQEGCLHNINYHNIDPALDSTADSNYIQGSPPKHHSASPRSHMNFSCKSARSSEQHPISHSCNQNLICRITEVSDQNFVSEDQEEKTKCVPVAKRMKMMPKLDASSKSQILPLGKLHGVIE